MNRFWTESERLALAGEGAVGTRPTRGVFTREIYAGQHLVCFVNGISVSECPVLGHHICVERNSVCTQEDLSAQLFL